MSVTPDAIRKLLDELEANRQSRKSAWATLQRLRKFLEATGVRIRIPEAHLQIEALFKAAVEAGEVTGFRQARCGPPAEVELSGPG